MNHSQTNHLLGYPPDARLLILNADDFGMCHATNEAIMRTLKNGPVRSTTLMVPCPWATHAMHFLGDHPEIPFGVHLTVVGDTDNYPWRPVTSLDRVPSLVDRAGFFFNRVKNPGLLDRVQFDQLEVEFRAQIEVVLAAGLKPTHLDWHSLRIGSRMDIFELMFGLAREYGLALRVAGRAVIEKVQGQGLPVIEHNFLDSSQLDPARKPALYAQKLRDLPSGLSEWAVHPGLDGPELLALEPDGRHFRQSDYDFWTSQEAKELIHREGIILLDYRTLQSFWRQK